jgi:TPP-dependent pyruvate/acetoin dehydrogenase alpha subunit
VIFLCQNNRYGEHTPISHHQRNESVAMRAAAYAMPGETVDGNDPVAVRDVVSTAVARARAGEGPTLVEAVTYRLFGHVFGDPMKYVERAEIDEAWAAEPTGRFRRSLDPDTASEIDARCADEVAVALSRALSDPEPGPEVLLEDVTSDQGSASQP